MYLHTEIAYALALTPTNWFYSLYSQTSEKHNKSDYRSRQENSLLLDNGASISIPNYPTYVTIANLLNITNNSTTLNSKTLTVANQTEVDILQYVTFTLNTNIDDSSSQFNIPFAVANIKYNILGTPFFEECIQNINIQDFILQFKHHSRDLPNSTK